MSPTPQTNESTAAKKQTHERPQQDPDATHMDTPTPFHQTGVFGSVTTFHTNEELEAATAILSLQQPVIFSNDRSDSEATEEDSEVTLDDPTVPDNEAAATFMSFRQTVAFDNDRSDVEDTVEDTTVQDNEAATALLALRRVGPSDCDRLNTEATVNDSTVRDTEATTAMQNLHQPVVNNNDRSDPEASVEDTSVQNAEVSATEERRKMSLKEYLALKKAKKAA
jgi:uncharacterized protein YeeX (DUF496 family)